VWLTFCVCAVCGAQSEAAEPQPVDVHKADEKQADAPVGLPPTPPTADEQPNPSIFATHDHSKVRGHVGDAGPGVGLVGPLALSYGPTSPLAVTGRSLTSPLDIYFIYILIYYVLMYIYMQVVFVAELHVYASLCPHALYITF
jgi:hypothetical protein